MAALAKIDLRSILAKKALPRALRVLFGQKGLAARLRFGVLALSFSQILRPTQRIEPTPNLGIGLRLLEKSRFFVIISRLITRPRKISLREIFRGKKVAKNCLR